MSMQEPGSMSGGPPARADATKHPNCPHCQRGMTVKQVMPVLFAPDIDDIVFGCEDCGTEVKRSVRRS